MKLFKCQECGQLIYFENDRCESCGRRLGFLPDRLVLSVVEASGEDWMARAASPDERFRLCANTEFGACNWMIAATSDENFCTACRHNSVIPDLALPENRSNWRKLERAKHRLFYSLLRLGLPLANRSDDPEHGLAFEFLATAPDTPKVMTGHDNGLITVALDEADSAERERVRHELGETYRTLLGHLRHETGHYFWDVLVRDAGKLEDCRAIFGDDRADYAAALERNYEQGAPEDWSAHFISRYATCHPWEDFAETWAHYLHIIDTLEIGAAFGLRIAPEIAEGSLGAALDFDPYQPGDIHRLIDAWLPLVFAVNNLNRAMGQPDLYPFVLTPAVIDKLGFIHRLVRERA